MTLHVGAENFVLAAIRLARTMGLSYREGMAAMVAAETLMERVNRQGPMAVDDIRKLTRTVFEGALVNDSRSTVLVSDFGLLGIEIGEGVDFVRLKEGDVKVSALARLAGLSDDQEDDPRLALGSNFARGGSAEEDPRVAAASYATERQLAAGMMPLVGLAGLEPAATCLEGTCSDPTELQPQQNNSIPPIAWTVGDRRIPNNPAAAAWDGVERRSVIGSAIAECEALVDRVMRGGQ